MKVGLNLVYLTADSGGSGTYARKLIPHLLEVDPGLELTAWIGATAPAWLTEQPWSGEVRWIRLPVPGVGNVWHLWHELAGIGLDARRRNIDVVHGLANIGPLAHPGVATVTTILDVIWVHHPEAATLRFRMMGRLVTPLVGRSSARIVAISEAARDDVASTLGLDPRKFDVTPLGIDVPAGGPAAMCSPGLAAQLQLGERPLVLCVAAKRAHKNLHSLVRAWALLPAPRPLLVLPGSPTPYEERLRALVQELDLQDCVRLVGWISDEDLRWLYEAASCFALPSRLEGFGLPVLEAMARDVPVACSDIPVFREVAGDAAMLFDPLSPESIAESVRRILGEADLARELVQAGRRRCAKFTWQATAQATLESYRRALGG